MTIPQLEVDLAGCFEVGQAYVALSRATSLEGLRLKVGPSMRTHASDAALIAQSL